MNELKINGLGASYAPSEIGPACVAREEIPRRHAACLELYRKSKGIRFSLV